MMTPGKLVEQANSGVEHVRLEQCDRDQMALGLFLQGYSAGRACQIAFVELEDNDGALQMLARHRIAAALRSREDQDNG